VSYSATVPAYDGYPAASPSGPAQTPGISMRTATAWWIMTLLTAAVMAPAPYVGRVHAERATESPAPARAVEGGVAAAKPKGQHVRTVTAD